MSETVKSVWNESNRPSVYQQRVYLMQSLDTITCGYSEDELLQMSFDDLPAGIREQLEIGWLSFD
jgi:hypothetical protein